MLKNLGKKLTKEQQKSINGGYTNIFCNTHRDCWESIPYAFPGDFSCVKRYGSFYGTCVPN
ncbi:hypothetical protein [uncultured Tenacibaculum sp.]|uniref:hypothetical protein n=1 Tax=Tenacibaculum sp. ZS6-P6 TaxID=3447503 RepID=UPI0026172858|nr:hypothetical protein [uncultured Tenacibaculum sp.]